MLTHVRLMNTLSYSCKRTMVKNYFFLQRTPIVKKKNPEDHVGIVVYFQI